MKSWLWLLLLLLLLLAASAYQPLTDPEAPGVAIALTTQTPTASRTPGWWGEIATWTPTPVRSVQEARTSTVVAVTATPALNIPPVATLRGTP